MKTVLVKLENISLLVCSYHLVIFIMRFFWQVNTWIMVGRANMRWFWTYANIYYLKVTQTRSYNISFILSHPLLNFKTVNGFKWVIAKWDLGVKFWLMYAQMNSSQSLPNPWLIGIWRLWELGITLKFTHSRGVIRYYATFPRNAFWVFRQDRLILICLEDSCLIICNTS